VALELLLLDIRFTAVVVCYLKKMECDLAGYWHDQFSWILPGFLAATIRV
jgi:hypothetical protein